VGVAFAEEASVTVSELLTRADAAMYRAKHSGKGRHATYAADTAAASVAASRVERIVRRTLDDDKVVVHYQPVADLRRGLVIGVEALARMPDGTGGFVPPDEFIPVAERCGMIGRLGDAVLRQTLAHTVAWKQILPEHHEFAAGVNLSVRQLGEPGLVARVEAALAEYALPPDALVLELTESVFSDSDEHAEVLRELRRLGVKLVIDDFGTGYSSLSYLRRFPIDGLKIDRSFVADLVGQDRNRTVTDAIVRMALDLRMPVIAEGIETGMQLSALQALGCPLGQGYLLSRPMTAEQMTALLAADAGRLPGAVLAAEKAWSSSS
jgi:EAL domain-containing protein (putative c-di-GMP-specific phosphodiesterase class I)